MAVLIVLWLYLLTTKLRCLQKNNIEHTKKGLAYLWRDPPKTVQNFWDTKVTEPRALYDEVESLHMHEA